MAKLQNFSTLDEEAEFWETHSLTDYLDELEDVDFHVEGTPEDTYLAIRVTPDIITALREVAEKRGISLQSLLREWIESVKAKMV